MLAHDPGTRAEIGRLLREHAEIRDACDALDELACVAHPWTDEERQALAAATARYAALAHAHIHREQHWLFPRARALATEARRRLAAGFAGFEAAENGGVHHQRHRELARDLTAAHECVHRHFGQTIAR
jgi:hemerythrin-like domain-containing protein